MLASALLLVHLVSFAAYLGAGFAQQQLVKSSRRGDLAAAVRADREVLAAAIVTRIELPAIFGSILSGIGFIAQNPAVMKFGWLHGKLLCVVLLAILSHVEMLNLRRIVRARSASGAEATEDAIDARKKRHATYGAIGTLLVVAILILVTFVRLG